MFNVIIKTAILYAVVIVAMRLMGKRQVGQLQPFEFVIAIMIAEVASTPMDDAGIPIMYGIAPIITLVFLHMLLAFLMMKSEKLRAVFSGKPSIIIEKGKIQSKQLKKLDYNLNDLVEQLRPSGVTSISDVYYAILETNGQMSVVLKPIQQSATRGDLRLVPENPGLVSALILDGKIHKKNLRTLKITKEDLETTVRSEGFGNIQSVLYAGIDETNNTFFQGYDGRQAQTDRLKRGD